MKYKTGDRVRIKSLDWYNENKNEDGFVLCGDRVFDDYMSEFCGSVVTICGTYPSGYGIREDMQCRTWTDEMIEGPVLKNVIQTDKSILKKWCKRNMSTHTDWMGTRVETINSCRSIDEFVDKLWDYLEDESDKMD